MKLKLPSEELKRMMKVALPCTEQRVSTKLSNIEIRTGEDGFTVFATNGPMSAFVKLPLLCGFVESFCVDGQTFARVVGASSGEVEISTDDKACYVKSAGRTRVPIVNCHLEAGTTSKDSGEFKNVSMNSTDFIRCFNSVAYAMSTDQTTRPILTGILVNSDGNRMCMTGLDGFQMSLEYVRCSGDEFSAVIPGAFMRLVSQSIAQNCNINLCVHDNRAIVTTDDMVLTSTLLAGQFPDVKHIMPDRFKIECLTDGGEFMNALKSGSVVNNKQNLVKLDITADNIRITNNGDNADYEADVPCMTTGLEHGETFRIAFNQKYLMNAVGAVSDDNVLLTFNSSISPCVAEKKSDEFGGRRLLLPVRLTQPQYAHAEGVK